MTAPEPEFYPDWYDLDIRSQHEEGEPIGNQAYMDWMGRVLTAATQRKIDWSQVELAVILDRSVQRDEARREVRA